MHKIKLSANYKTWDEGKVEEPAKSLSREQAAVLRLQNPSLSPWVVLAGQAAMGGVVALAAWSITGKQNIGWSALYGALAVVVPGALFARGLLSKVTLMNPSAAVTGFFLWEMVKIGLVLAMLYAAPKLVSDLSWPAMLVGLVLTMKAVWLVLWLESTARRRSKELNVSNLTSSNKEI